MTRSLPVSASFIIELNATVEGVYQPYVPARGPSYSSGGEPAEGDYCEDVAIAGLTLDIKDGMIEDMNGKLIPNWREIDLLEGVDTSSPAIIRLLANILDCVMGEAQEELREAAADE